MHHVYNLALGLMLSRTYRAILPKVGIRKATKLAILNSDLRRPGSMFNVRCYDYIKLGEKVVGGMSQRRVAKTGSTND